MNRAKPLIVVVGETASGKSSLALALAEKFNGELISADSWTVYKEFDVGTAKPSAEELVRVPHHLLDVADPEKGFNAVEFQRLARAAIEDIQARGKLPILVGGTGLYVDSILFDYQFLPATDPELRSVLETMTLSDLQQKVHEMTLNTIGIDLKNKRRVIRLIENSGERPAKNTPRSSTLIIGIQVDRELLRERVTARVDGMLQAGLEQEVRTLAKKYGWDAEPMKGIGYREWQPRFEGYQNQAGQKEYQGLEQTRERIVAATMGLAKRQRTWFKRNDRIHWVQGSNTLAESVDLVTTFLDTNS
jgi:tRNA dimethylallyltransferase